MAKKPHVKLNSARQNEKTVKMSFNYGFGEEDEKKIENPNYIPMVDTFRRSIDQLNIDQETRRLERNELLQIPSHIEYIQIWFQDQFDIKNFYNSWLTDFGLLGIKFSLFSFIQIKTNSAHLLLLGLIILSGLQCESLTISCNFCITSSLV